MPVLPLTRNTSLNRGEISASIPTGAATTAVSGSSGRLIRAVVTTAGTAGADVVFVDHGTGNVITSIPGTLPLGAVVWFNQAKNAGIDFGTGLDVINVASGPVFTLVYS
jgi:hypothetical protein